MSYIATPALDNFAANLTEYSIGCDAYYLIEHDRKYVHLDVSKEKVFADIKRTEALPEYKVFKASPDSKRLTITYVPRKYTCLVEAFSVTGTPILNIPIASGKFIYKNCLFTIQGRKIMDAMGEETKLIKIVKLEEGMYIVPCNGSVTLTFTSE